MGGEFYPIGRNKIKINIVTKMDPKIKFIPLMLLNWITRKAAQFLLEKLVKKATNFKVNNCICLSLILLGKFMGEKDPRR